MNTQTIGSLFAESDTAEFITFADTKVLCLAFPFNKKDFKSHHNH